MSSSNITFMALNGEMGMPYHFLMAGNDQELPALVCAVDAVQALVLKLRFLKRY